MECAFDDQVNNAEILQKAKKNPKVMGFTNIHPVQGISWRPSFHIYSHWRNAKWQTQHITVPCCYIKQRTFCECATWGPIHYYILAGHISIAN
jgi:hypothetical protein